MPKVLLHKLMITILFIPGCFITGSVFYITLKDIVLFRLSLVICTAILIKCIGMYYTFHTKNYDTYEVTCKLIKPRILSRWNDVYFTDNDNEETVFQFDKNIRFCIDTRYRLYFNKNTGTSTGILNSNYIKEKLFIGNFLGMEYITK